MLTVLDSKLLPRSLFVTVGRLGYDREHVPRLSHTGFFCDQLPQCLPFDVIILGAGAAGLMCAMTAGQRGRRVLLLDHAAQPGAKILISGGGRCNFTNTGTAPERFLSENPHFHRSALGRYSPDDFIALVQSHGIAFHEKTKGQLFCDGSARAIVAMLLADAQAAAVDLRLAHTITGVGKADSFRIDTDHGAFTATSLVLATGGLSIPKLGATGFAYDVARRFGLRVSETRPGLVPLTFGEDLLALMRPLAGVALDTEVRHGRHRFRDAVLFTHRGMSGPAILQISSYWREGPIVLNLLPDLDAAAFLLDRKRSRPKAELRTVLAEQLPHRLAQALAGDNVPALAADHAGSRVAQTLARTSLQGPGPSPRPAPKVLRKPRSPQAASIPETFHRKPCNP